MDSLKSNTQDEQKLNSDKNTVLMTKEEADFLMPLIQVELEKIFKSTKKFNLVQNQPHPNLDEYSICISLFPKEKDSEDLEDLKEREDIFNQINFFLRQVKPYFYMSRNGSFHVFHVRQAPLLKLAYGFD